MQRKIALAVLGEKVVSGGSTLRTRAYTVLYGGLIGLVLFAFVLGHMLPPQIMGMPKLPVMGVIVLVSWFVFLTKAMPRCSRCGMGVLSLVEVGRVPVIVKSWVGSHCSRCGAGLE